MKTNNRPTIKLVEWEVRTKSDFLLWNSPDDTAIWDGERTGNTREVERPMNDTEYIEYLEKENQELKVLLTNTALKDISRIAEIQEQYLKVVESVLYNIDFPDTDFIDGYNFGLYTKSYSFDQDGVWRIIREIKSAIESTNLPKSQDKSTNLEQVQDKKGKDEKEK